MVSSEAEKADKPKKQKKAKEAEDDDEEKRELKFRNYVPRTAELKELVLPAVSTTELETSIDKEIEEAIETAENEDAVMAIAPKKPNWDLKREVERKMVVLNARTDRAIVQLIRQRIAAAKAAPAKAPTSADDEA